MFRPTNQPTIAELAERVRTCEQQVAQQVPIGRLLAAVVAMIERFKPSKETVRVEIVRWPSEFARQLALVGVKCDSTVREVARLYTESLHDVAKAEELLALAAQEDGDELQKRARDMALRFRRQLQYRRDNLRELGVTVVEVSKGDPFNPAIHEPICTEPSDDSLADTIAEAITPLFTWRDETGLEQHVPAHVIVFATNGRASGVSS